MNCHKCNIEMETGYIYSSRPMKWTKKYSNWREKGESLTSDASSFKLFSFNHIPAWRCTKCRRIEIQY